MASQSNLLGCFHHFIIDYMEKRLKVRINSNRMQE